MVDFGRMAQKGTPYLEEEIPDIIRLTAIELGVRDPVKHQPYTMDSNVTRLVEGFLRRCREHGVPFAPKVGRGLAMQRAAAQNVEGFIKYRDEVIRHPEDGVIAFQKKNGVKLGLNDVGNWDEGMVDLCDFAQKGGNYLFIQGLGEDVVIPFEQSPHFTIVTGFIGDKHLVVMLIKIGSEYVAPHPFHTQLLTNQWTVVLAQSPSGWVDTRLKAAFLKLQLECPHNPLGSAPKVINVDGHGSNTNNEEMREDAIKAKIWMGCPPSHTSAPVNGRGTQQCDLPAKLGGPVVREKSQIRRLLTRQFRVALQKTGPDKGRVSIAEILAICELAIESEWKPELAMRMNAEVGWFINDEGYLDWDLTRLLDQDAAQPAHFRTGEADSADARGALDSTRSGKRRAVEQHQANVNVALLQGEKEMRAAGVAIRVHNTAPVAAPTIPIPRTAGAPSANKYGCCITRESGPAQEAADKQKAAEAARKKDETQRRFWGNWRHDVRCAEATLAEHGTPSKSSAKQLKALIVSRTGHCARAANNKPVAEGGEGATLIEARAAIAAHDATLCPPTPEPLASCAPADVLCAVCEAAGQSSDVTSNDEGLCFCTTCGSRLEAAENSAAVVAPAVAAAAADMES